MKKHQIIREAQESAAIWVAENAVVLPHNEGELVVFLSLYIADRLEQQPKVEGCQYEADDTTAMNCKWCGNPKWAHANCCYQYLELSHHPQPISDERIEELWEEYSSIGDGWGITRDSFYELIEEFNNE